jgi:hypothetical protein
VAIKSRAIVFLFIFILIQNSMSKQVRKNGTINTSAAEPDGKRRKVASPEPMPTIPAEFLDDTLPDLENVDTTDSTSPKSPDEQMPATNRSSETQASSTPLPFLQPSQMPLNKWGGLRAWRQTKVGPDSVWEHEPIDYSQICVKLAVKKNKQSPDFIDINYKFKDGRVVPLVVQTPRMTVIYASYDAVFKAKPGEAREGEKPGAPRSTFGLAFDIKSIDEYDTLTAPSGYKPDGTESPAQNFFLQLRRMETEIINLLISQKSTLLRGVAWFFDGPNGKRVPNPEAPTDREIRRWFNFATQYKVNTDDPANPIRKPPLFNLRIEKSGKFYDTEAFMRVDSVKEPGKVTTVPIPLTTIDKRYDLSAMVEYARLFIRGNQIYPQFKAKQVTVISTQSVHSSGHAAPVDF